MASVLQVAIVGAGPSGFYAAEALLRQGIDLEVTLIERLPIPYGLVRNGVAPDHASLKQVCRLFERTGNNPRVEFLGNTEFGLHVSLVELRQIFHAVVLATGADCDRPLATARNSIDSVYTASEIVGWYNSHPDHARIAPAFGRGRICIFGHGNVAADIARILLSDPDRLCKTDISAAALAQLASRPVRKVHLVGRRGPAETRFTAPVLTELLALPGVKTAIDAPLGDEDCRPGTHASGFGLQIPQILRNATTRGGSSAESQLHFHFNSHLSSLHRDHDILRIQLTGPASEPRELQADIAITAIGFHVKEARDASLHVNDGMLNNEKGRLLDRHNHVIPDGYAVGWAARGASGTIGTCRSEAERLARTISSDAPALLRKPARGCPALREFLATKGHSPVTFEQWQRLDRYEKATGAAIGRPRLKMRSVQEMLATLEGESASETDIRRNA